MGVKRGHIWKAEPQTSETGDPAAPVAQTGQLGGGSRRKQFGGRGRRGFPIRDTLSGSSGGPWARGSSQMSWSPLRGEEGGESASSLPHSGWHSWVARPYLPAAWSVPSLLWSCGPFIFPGSSEWQQLNYLISAGERAIPPRASAEDAPATRPLHSWVWHLSPSLSCPGPVTCREPATITVGGRG